MIDNELHPETLASRLRTVADARGIPVASVSQRIELLPLRGRLQNIRSLGEFLRGIPPRRFSMIVIDAFYRVVPDGIDENSNAQMAGIYNLIDSYADRLESSFVLVHHSSKGNQAGKAVTDVGSGAGSMSRATDAHLILRPHEEEDVVVLDAAVRSFAPVEPLCLRWHFPLWSIATGLNPAALHDPKKADPKAEDTAFLLKLDSLDPGAHGVSETAIRTALQWGQPKVKRTIARLLAAGVLSRAPLILNTGFGAKSQCDGIKRGGIGNGSLNGSSFP